MRLVAISQSIFIAASLLLLGCNPDHSVKSERGDIDVQIPVPAKRDENGNLNGPTFTFEVVKLLNVFNLNKVRGKFARFYLSPKIENDRLQGVFPDADFIKNKNNVYTPTNELSAKMSSIYYHIQNMALLDAKLGLGSINKLPRDIGIDVKYKNSKESTGFDKDNVFYEGKYDAIIFAPNENDSIPIAINGGIIAHEHFHSLFHKLVMEKLLKEKIITKEIPLTTHYLEDILEEDIPQPTEESGKVPEISAEQIKSSYNLVLLKGLNEGLADFWGWMYTNDDNFIIHSLPEVAEDRTLKIKKEDLPSLKIPTQDQIVSMIKVFSQNKGSFGGRLNFYSYDLGTQFARVMKVFAEKRKELKSVKLQSAKDDMAKAVVKFISNLPKTFKSKAQEKMVEPAELVVQMILGIENLTVAECESVMQILTRTQEGQSEHKCKSENGKVTLQ